MAAVNKQLKPLIESYLVSYREVEFTEIFLITNLWYDMFICHVATDGTLLSLAISPDVAKFTTF